MKEIKKRVERALSLLRNPRGSKIGTIVKLVNEHGPSLHLKTILQQLHEEVEKGRLSVKDGRFKLKRGRNSFEDYDPDEVDDEEYDYYEDEEREDDDREGLAYGQPEREDDGTSHPKGETEKDKEKDEKPSNKDLTGKQENENDNENTGGQAFEGEKLYPCCPKKKKKPCPKKKKKACPKKKKKACPKKKKKACPKKKKKPSCPKKKPRCPKPKCPPMDDSDDDECDGEAKPASPAASFNSFDLRGPRCTSMKKELRPPSKVQLPLAGPVGPQRNYNDDLARRTPDPASGPLFDDDKKMMVDTDLPALPCAQKFF